MRTLATLLLLSSSIAHADVALLLEAPYGGFWSMDPAHSAIYLTRICAESPILLRRCAPGEQGAVISRYHRIAPYDWVAIPYIAYLYAVDRRNQVPEEASSDEIASLRDVYRRTHLQAVAPDQSDGRQPPGDWRQLVGEAYDRTIYGFRIQTTAEQDDKLIQWLNSQPNRSQFSLVFRNCADFAREIIDFYFPDAIHRSLIPDLEIKTPRHAAACLVGYSRQHPELAFSTFVIQQVSGTIPRSKAMRDFSRARRARELPRPGSRNLKL